MSVMDQATQTIKPKRGAPPDVLELIDVAIFTFCSMSGVTQRDKIRGNSIVLGVVAIFFHVLKAAKESTKNAFAELCNSSTVDKPGKLQTLITSRLKYAKKHDINNRSMANVPPAMFEAEEMVDEEAERIRTIPHPRCWRCKQLCRLCEMEPKDRNFLHFRSELVSPLLDVFDYQSKAAYGPDESSSESSSESDEEMDGLPKEAKEDDIELLKEKFFKENYEENDDRDESEDDYDDNNEEEIENDGISDDVDEASN